MGRASSVKALSIIFPTRCANRQYSKAEIIGFYFLHLKYISVRLFQHGSRNRFRIKIIPAIIRGNTRMAVTQTYEMRLLLLYGSMQLLEIDVVRE